MSTPSLIAQLLTFPLKTICWVVLGWVLSVIFNLVLSTLSQNSSAFSPASERLEEESRNLASETTNRIFSANQFYSQLNTGFDRIKSNLGNRLREIETRTGSNLLDHRSFEIVGATTQLVLLRVSALASIVPVLLIWIALAAIEGLTQRAIRRYRGGRESATTYHIAKRLAKPTIAWTGLIYLCSPTVIYVETVYIFLAIVIPATTFVAASRFKKYL